MTVMSAIRNVLGMDVVLARFRRDEDRINSPTARYEAARVHDGIRSWARVLATLSR